MSIEHTTTTQKEVTDRGIETADDQLDRDIESIQVSDHAVLRFRQRVDPRAARPKDQIRQMFRQGTVAHASDRIRDGKARRYDGYLILYAGSEAQPTITTVLPKIEAPRHD